jgi:cytochrome c oxidase subunit 2
MDRPHDRRPFLKVATLGVALASALPGCAGKPREAPAHQASALPGEHAAGERTVPVVARRFAFDPPTITLKRGEPVVLELRSLDRLHGFSAPALGLDAQIPPDTVTHLRFTPDRAGTFPVHCHVFCGEGHEGMNAQIVVTP